MPPTSDWLLKIRMFFNNLSPLHIVYSKDESGQYIKDSEGDPVPERYEPPTFFTNWRWWLIGAIVLYGIYQLIKLVLTIKLQKK